VNSARIMIEDGAYIKGKIEIVKPEPAPGARPASAVSVASPAGPPAASAAAAPPPAPAGSTR
jgi:hypothetical protein